LTNSDKIYYLYIFLILLNNEIMPDFAAQLEKIHHQLKFTNQGNLSKSTCNESEKEQLAREEATTNVRKVKEFSAREQSQLKGYKDQLTDVYLTLITYIPDKDKSEFQKSFGVLNQKIDGTKSYKKWITRVIESREKLAPIEENSAKKTSRQMVALEERISDEELLAAFNTYKTFVLNGRYFANDAESEKLSKAAWNYLTLEKKYKEQTMGNLPDKVKNLSENDIFLNSIHRPYFDIIERNNAAAAACMR
jgi:hypothetical protein